MREARAAVLAFAAVLIALALGAGVAFAETTDWISYDENIDWANGDSTNSDISADGNLVAFESEATDLGWLDGTEVDTNDGQDVFIHDRVFLNTEMVSVNADGDAAGNGESSAPSVSPDGQYVAFQSEATDLVLGDNNGFVDIFLRNLLTDETVLMSRHTDGTQGDGDSTDPAVTADDERVFVAYESVATNLVDSDTNGVIRSIFLSYFYKDDPSTIVTELVDRRTDGTQGINSNGSRNVDISDDGTYVAYESFFWNERTPDGTAYVDTDYLWDVYVTDWDKDGSRGHVITKLVSVETGGTEVTDAECTNPAISGDGQYVAYDSASQGLTGDSDTNVDVFRTDWSYDSAEMVTVKVSQDVGGGTANGDSEYPSISYDGSYVAFESDASDLVAGDGNGLRDVFVRDMSTDTNYLVSNDFFAGASDADSGGHGSSTGPKITAAMGGMVPEVSFFSEATNLVWGYEEDPDAGFRDVFVASTDTTPRIDLVMPDMGPTMGGIPVYIVGANFLDDWVYSGGWAAPESADTVIYFGDVPVTEWYWFGPKLLFTVLPAHEPGMVQVKVVAGGGETADTPADDFTYVPGFLSSKFQPPRVAARIEQDDAQIVYTGEWSDGEDEELSVDADVHTDDAEATVTITFTGTQLDWIATLGPTMGKALVSVDGGAAVLVDLYSETELYQQVAWSTGVLAYGEHTVTITFPEGDDYVEGSTLNIDAFDVYGNTPALADAWTPNWELYYYLDQIYMQLYEGDPF